MAIRKISEFVEASSPQNSDKLLLERNGSGKSITVGNLLNDVVTRTRINLLEPSLRTTKKNGVTCTDNGNGTYTINGTASDYTAFTVGYPLVDRYKQYRLVGCPSGGTFEPDVGYKVFINYDDVYFIDYGAGENFSATKTATLRVVIQVNTGTVCDNLLFKPMITDDLSATYDDFVSYNDSFITGISNGMNVDFLWENANPTGSFSSQTLTFNVNLETYKYVCIVCRYINTTDIREVNFIKPDNNYYLLHAMRDSVYWRYQTRCYSNVIEIGDGLIGETVNQNACIPVQIYGVK